MGLKDDAASYEHIADGDPRFCTVEQSMRRAMDEQARVIGYVRSMLQEIRGFAKTQMAANVRGSYHIYNAAELALAKLDKGETI